MRELDNNSMMMTGSPDIYSEPSKAVILIFLTELDDAKPDDQRENNIEVIKARFRKRWRTNPQ